MKDIKRIAILALLFTLTLAGCAPQGEVSEAEEESTEAADTTKPDEKKKPSSKPKPAAIVLPAGTEIDVRLITGLSSKENTDGDSFDGMAEADVVVDGKVAIPRDAKITGTVTKVVKSGRFKGRAELWISLASVTVDGKSYALATDTVGQKEGSKAKRNILFIGGGTGAGAAVGAVAGNSGKDTATGAAIGAAAGTAGALLTGKRDIEFPSESLLRFKLEETVKIQQ